MNPLELAATALRGFAMGAADIVPGVSGGTIALILGIYERLIESVRNGARALGQLARGNPRSFFDRLRAIEWTFIVPLLVGVLAAVVVLSSIIDGLLEREPEAMAGLFFGLVAASILVAWQLLHRRDAVRFAVLGAVAVISFVLLGLQSGVVNDPSLLVFLVSGSIAICAMILPGISGSFLLLMLGMYGAVVGAVHDRELVEIAVFGIGAILGLAVFSTGLGWVLDHHRDTLLAALIGLMAGSLRVLWPWPHGVGVIGDDAEQVDGTQIDLPASWEEAWLPILLGIIAFVVVAAVSRLAPHDQADNQPSSSGAERTSR